MPAGGVFVKSVEELRAFFRADRFAMAQGITIESADEKGAVCSLELRFDQKNAMGSAQGGLVYTLADFAFAVAANAISFGTVTLNSTIHYLKGVGEGRLTAAARLKSQSRTICVYEVEVTGPTGQPLALATMTGYIKPQSDP